MAFRVLFSLFGFVAIAAGVWGLKTLQTSLVADRNGIWVSGTSFFRKTLIPWDVTFGAKKIVWKSWEGEHEAILLSLREDFVPPGGIEFREIVRTELTKLIGRVGSPNFLVLGHDEWDWELDDFVRFASTCIDDQAARNELEEFIQ